MKYVAFVLLIVGIIFAQTFVSGAVGNPNGESNSSLGFGIFANDHNAFWTNPSLASFSITDLRVNEFLAINNSIIADEFGDYDDWIEIYNAGSTPVYLAGIYISDDFTEPDKWQIPFTDSASTIIPPDSFIVLWADGEPEQGVLHLDFKLSGDGEQIVIYTPDLTTLIDSITFAEQCPDVSCGRQPDGAGGWLFFPEPTQGSSNITSGATGVCPEPIVSIPPGFYSDSVVVGLSVGATGFEIRYTLNGLEPTATSALYSSPIHISETTPLRAKTFRDGYIPSQIQTFTYIIDEIFILPTMSLVTSPDNLWGTYGIYDHRFEDWEKPIHIEYFEDDSTLGFTLDGGVKIHAPDARPQQSLRLYARSEYGDNEIEYRLFEDKEIDTFKRLVLRNGGNDGMQLGLTQIRDAFLSIVFRQTNPANSMSSYKPVHVFLNGEYWGIYNLRERQDRFYIASNFDYDDDMDFLERDAHEPDTRHAIEGDWEAFDSLHDFIDTMDMSIDTNYAYVKTRMDVENFAEYWIFEVFAGNRDWLSNNVRFWRPRTSDGVWRWILWDVEYGLGCFYPDYDHGFPDWDCLGWSTRPGGGWSGTGDNTVIIRNLLENDEFKYYFIIRFADLLNTNLRPSYTVPVIDSLQNDLLADVYWQIDRWGSSLALWIQKVQELRNYVTDRPFYLRQHIITKFELDTLYTATIDVDPPGTGIIELNTISLNSFPWNGIYFTTVPIVMEAVPNDGYSFVGWDGAYSSNILVSRGSVWKYLDTGADMGTSWSAPSFDDSSWPSGNAQLGYGDGDEATVVDYGPDPDNKYVTTYFRSTFTVSDSAEYFDLHLSLLRDDGAIVYLNGYEVARSNMPTGAIDYLALASVPVTDGDENLFFDFPVDTSYLVTGTNILAVEIHQSALNSTDISFDLEFAGTRAVDDSSVIEISPMGDIELTALFGFTTIMDGTAAIPTKKSLFRNYPNPFNSSTAIEFGLPVDTHVKIAIYDIHGRKVATLLDEPMKAGVHSLVWDSGNRDGVAVPSGVYFCNIETPDSREVKKMVLVK